MYVQYTINCVCVRMCVATAQASRARCTVGEISDALEKVYIYYQYSHHLAPTPVFCPCVHVHVHVGLGTVHILGSILLACRVLSFLHVPIVQWPLCFLQVHGRHVAVPRMVSGAYAQEYGHAEEMDRALQKVQVSCVPLVPLPFTPQCHTHGKKTVMVGPCTCTGVCSCLFFLILLHVHMLVCYTIFSMYTCACI